MMDTRDCACGQTTVRDDAARWFVRLQEPAIDGVEQQRFDAWLNQHPQHRDEFQLLQGLWSAADLLPAPRLKALVETPPTRRERRPMLRYAVAASVLAVSLDDARLTWPERELIRQLGEKLYGNRPKRQETRHG